jgi:hypothetical protein
MAATSEQAAAKALEVLRRFWGYNAFREPQAAVISNALAGSDALVVMATGGGKSICYQVPPLVTGACAAAHARCLSAALAPPRCGALRLAARCAVCTLPPPTQARCASWCRR